MTLCPIITDVQGPALTTTKKKLKKLGKVDIIDETLKYFRINVLFKNYEIKGNADVLLFYLTVYTGYCLKKLKKM